MVFTINYKIFELFPDLILGVIIAKNINNQGNEPEISQELTEQEKLLPKNITGELIEYQKIAVWREAYKKFGAKPKNYPPSLEALAKRVIKGDSLPRINKLIDLYNTISLKYLVPVGGEDLDKTVGNIELTLATGQEEFIALGEAENRPPKAGEVIYKDDKGVIVRRFNWRESERCKFTDKTKNAILVIEGLLPTTKENIEQAINELKENIEKYCGGELETYILNKDNREINIG